MLNRFLYTSQLSNGLFQTRLTEELKGGDRPAYEALCDIPSDAWYLSDRGELKLQDNLSTLLPQVIANASQVFRAVIVYYVSALEDYLDARFPDKSADNLSWGPYVQSLAMPTLLNAEYPVRLDTVLRADVCRLVRNRIIHEPANIPTELDDAGICRRMEGITSVKQVERWRGDVKVSVNSAIQFVIGEAIRKRLEERQRDRDVPIELFYCLFALANLDDLAFEIEEACQEPGCRAGAPTILRREDKVRRVDLIAPRE